MEIIFQVIFELLIQLLFEGVMDLAMARTAEGRPFLRVVLFLFVGAAAGAVSLWLVPHHLIALRALRYASVLIVPILIGLAMTEIGSWRRKRGSEPYSMEHFVTGWAFAFAFGAVRVVFAK